jgi:hypothetical protein
MYQYDGMEILFNALRWDRRIERNPADRLNTAYGAWHALRSTALRVSDLINIYLQLKLTLKSTLIFPFWPLAHHRYPSLASSSYAR